MDHDSVVTSRPRGAAWSSGSAAEPVVTGVDDGSPSLRHLLGRLGLVEARVRDLVNRRRRADPEPDDPVRGLYISDEQVDRLLRQPPEPLQPMDTAARLEEIEREADEAEERGADVRLRRLARCFGLDDVDVEALLVAVAPDLDTRFERLYGYLQDDVTRRQAGIGLVLDLLGLDAAGAGARRRLTTQGALARAGLIEVIDRDRPFLTRSLQVPDRVTAHLLGDDTPEREVANLLVEVPIAEVSGAQEVSRCVRSGLRLAYVRDSARTAGVAAAVSGLAAAGWQALVADTGRIAQDHARDVLAAAVREAGLAGAALVAGPIDGLVEPDAGVLAEVADAPVPVVLVGRTAWDPSWTSELPAVVTAGPLAREAREELWDQLVPAGTGVDAATATVQFRLTPEQALRTWQAAQREAATAGRPVSEEDLRVGARLQNAGRLDHLARRIPPVADFSDLVLPARVMRLLREIAERARFRERVLDDWRMGGRSDKGRGITALFSGESGTGKTLSAEVVANELGLDLYVIDLSTVVDKYIGETEKNLERIFDEAEDVNGVLFFDEADALFGKRSEVSDARDRYANVEIAYLLQRMERFDGITVLATNLRANLDEAFTRRIDVLVGFPEPEEDDRRRLWELHLPETLPRDDDLALDFLAKAFELSGGDIRNVTLAAAYATAVDGGRVTTEQLVRATAREYRKLGRLVTESEFGDWFEMLTELTPSV